MTDESPAKTSEKKEILSFFFLGTGQHRETHQHVLTQYYKAIQNENNSNVAVRLFDGVGSKPPAGPSDYTPGTYIYNSESDEKVPIHNQEHLRKMHDFYQQAVGNMGGEGLEELVVEAIQYLEKIKEENGGELPKTINIHGFSRGADGAVRLANWIYRLHPEIKVNLFLLDHVPGPVKRDDEDSYTIPPNVERLDANIMLHEYRPVFKAQDKRRYIIKAPDKTKVSFKILAGDHNHQMRLYGDKVQASAKLVHDDFRNFARETGSLSENAPTPGYISKNDVGQYQEEEAQQSLSLYERFKLYEEMQENEPYYAQGRPQFYQRDALRHREEYVKDPELFFNQEHREIFKELYPAIFSWTFEQNIMGSNEDQRREEHSKLESDHPYFYNRLMNYYRKNSINYKNPGGMRKEEEPPLLGQVLVSDGLSRLQFELERIANYQLQHASDTNTEKKNQALRLLKLVEESKNKGTKEEAIAYLENGVRRELKFIQTLGHKGYLVNSLNQAVPQPERYKDKMEEMLKSEGYKLSQVDKLNLKYILDDKETTAIEKIDLMNQRLNSIDTKDKKELKAAIQKFINPQSLAVRLEKRLSSYIKHRKLINRPIEFINSVMGLKIPLPYSSDKLNELEQLMNKLSSIDDEQNVDNKEYIENLANDSPASKEFKTMLERESPDSHSKTKAKVSTPEPARRLGL
jgi:hypothetical protein